MSKRSKAQRLTDEHAKAVMEAQAYLDEVSDSDGLSAEQRAKIDAMTSEAADLREQRDAAVRLEQLAAEGSKRAELWLDAAAPDGGRLVDQTPTLEDEQNQVRAMGLQFHATEEEQYRRAAPSMKINMTRAAMEKQLIRMGVGRDDIRAMSQRGRAPMIAPDGTMAERSLDTGSTTGGDHLIPTYFERTLYDVMEYLGGIQAAGAEVIRTMNGAPLELPQVTAHFAPTGAMETTEGATVAETQDTYGETVLNSYAYTGASTITKEFLQDTYIDLIGHLSRALGRVVMHKKEERFTNGTGSSQPKGVFHSPPAGQTQTTAGSNTIAYGDLTGVIFGLDASYIIDKSAARWSLAPAVYQHILEIKDSDGRPLFTPSLWASEPDTILGRRVVYNAHSPSALADNDIAIACGSFMDAYVIREVGNITLSASEHVKFDERKTMFLMEQRADGKLRDSSALRWLKIKA